MKEMVAVICKCAKHNKLFGIRFDQINNRTWEYAWAFPLKDGADRREQGFSTTMRGTFEEGANYPGCPHCGAKGFFLCSCGHISCWDQRTMTAHCYFCNQDVTLGGEVTEIGGSGGL